MKRFRLIALAAFLLGSCTLWAQTADQGSAAATVTFNRVWDPITPQNITITVALDGHAKYVSHSDAKPPDVPESDDYKTEFTVTPTCKEKIFRSTKDTNYFAGDFSYKKRVASTGKKTLTYMDSTHHSDTSYDYSENKDIEELTSIFEGISNTVEYGRKLEFKHHYDKLGLEDELKGMEAAQASHSLQQLQLIASTLKSIVEDTSVLNIARRRAERLLAKASSE
jgi:hypothetical protein